jgi:phospholipid/cholesterol/gamma-HCH transport system substrate-binding protein
MKISKYQKLGFVLLFTLTAFVWGLSYLKGHDFFKPVDYYYTRYARVDGLLESSPVTFNGYRVGNVKKIKFTDDNSGDLIVTFLLENSLKIPDKSVVRIVSSDIMGTRSVKLIFNPSETYYTPGDTISGEIESDLKEQVSLQVLPLKKKAEELLSTIDSAITVLTVIFNEDARKNLSESFSNINQTIYNLEKTSADLADLFSQQKENMSNLVRNLNNFTGTLDKNSANFNKIIQNLSSFSDTLATLPIEPVITDLAKAVHNFQDVLTRLNSDKSTLGLLFNDDELYYNLTRLTAQLGNLTTDLKNNPKRYLHFSAVNLGKEVYVNTTGTPAGTKQNIVFKVHLISATEQVPLNSPLFESLDKVEEIEISGAYTYLSGNYANYSDAEKELTKAWRKFPDATIIAFKDGKILPIEKAMRMLKK